MDSQTKNPHRYDDIMELPRPISRTHPKMDIRDRAAQFAPFAALTGYGAVIAEEQRLTDREVELDEDIRELLDEKMQMLIEQVKRHPKVGITCFIPDPRKAGGTYTTQIGTVQKIDAYRQAILLENGNEIPFQRVYDIEFL